MRQNVTFADGANRVQFAKSNKLCDVFGVIALALSNGFASSKWLLDVGVRRCNET
jgi:hypothetical protein